MRPLILIFELVLPALYFLTVWNYAKSFFSGLREAESRKSILLVTTILFHSLYIVVRAIEYRHPPITTIFEILSLIAYTVAVVYAYIEFRTRNNSTGYFILMLPFFFQLCSSIFIKEPTQIPAILRSNLLGFHVSSALLGYAAITIAGVYGVLYLMLYHDIKSSQFGVIYKRLPNLETLEKMSLTATGFGFALLTIAIVVGLIWLPRAIPDFSYADPKLFGTLAIWVIYAMGLLARRIAGWRGKRIMWFSIFGFGLAIFSITVINLFFTGFHKFD